MEKNDWIVNVKGNPESRKWELAIVKRHNGTGLNAFGGWNSEKIRVSISDGFACDRVLFDSLMTLAYHHAIYLNRRDGFEEVPKELVKEAVKEKKAAKKFPNKPKVMV